MTELSLVHTLPVENQLGECVLWDAQAGEVVWTDILGKKWYRYDPVTDRLHVTPTPDRLASFALTHQPGILLAAFAAGIALWEPASGWLKVLYPLGDAVELRLNDGRMDHRGNFWVGAMIENAGNQTPFPHKQASLYRLAPDGEVTRQRTGIRISNSLCFSRDNASMFFADSPTHTIERITLTATGTVGTSENFAITPEGIHPDGSTLDAEGCLWNAEWGSGEIVRYGPDGGCLLRQELPAKQITCPAFGGATLSQLFVTSARCDLDSGQLAQQPAAGALFILDTPFTGCQEPRFDASQLL